LAFNITPGNKLPRPFEIQDLFISRSIASAEKSDGNWMAKRTAGMYEALHGHPKLISNYHYRKWRERPEESPAPRSCSTSPSSLARHHHSIPVKGYYHWSLVDNFEWERGWTQRFGLWELDIETQARRKRPSVDLYTEICRQNGISSEMVAHYTPQLLNDLFPEE
jgi:beta-glucosidase